MITDPRYPRGNLYLSGGMHRDNNLGAAWREKESALLLAMGYLPLDITALDVAYANAHDDIKRRPPEHDYLKTKSDIRRHFIDADINLIRNDTDAIVLFYDEFVRIGAGTLSEAYEAYTLNMPLFLVNDYPITKEIPGWLQAETTRIFSSFEELNLYLEKLPFGILKRDVYGNRRSGRHYLCSLCGEVEEKHGDHFVSRISPVYCKSCVEVVTQTYEHQKDRYEFFVEFLTKSTHNERSEVTST